MSFRRALLLALIASHAPGPSWEGASLGEFRLAVAAPQDGAALPGKKPQVSLNANGELVVDGAVNPKFVISPGNDGIQLGHADFLTVNGVPMSVDIEGALTYGGGRLSAMFDETDSKAKSDYAVRRALWDAASEARLTYWKEQARVREEAEAKVAAEKRETERRRRRFGPKGKLKIFLESTLASLQGLPCFKGWIAQLKKEGYEPQVLEFHPEGLAVAQRALLAGQPDVVGSITLGNLPIDAPKVQRAEGAGENQTQLPLMNPGQTFPNLGASDAGFYRGISKWAGRISDGPGEATEKRLERYCAYFKRNVEFRDCDTPSGRSLKVAGYVGDDWKGLDGNQAFSCLSQDCHVLQSIGQLRELPRVTGSVGPVDVCQLSIHSNPREHSDNRGKFGVSDIVKADPKVRFYVLFACSAGACGLKEKSLAETYLLHTSSTLGALASSRPGAISDTRLFYQFLQGGDTYGEAFMRYAQGFEGNPGKVDFDGGLILYGDPTLRLHGCD